MFSFSLLEFTFRVHKVVFKGVTCFGDDLYTGMSKASPKFFTKAWTIGDRDEDIFS